MKRVEADGVTRYRWRAGTALALCTLLAVVPPAARGQWKLVEPRETTAANSTTSANGTEGKAAAVRNEEGLVLSIHRGGNDRVYGSLVLSKSLARLAPNACATYRVDDSPARALGKIGSCRTSGSVLTFRIGEITDDELASDTVLALMNGSELEIVYHLENFGYFETSFTLRGSKQALGAALGKSVQVIEP